MSVTSNGVGNGHGTVAAKPARKTTAPPATGGHNAPAGSKVSFQTPDGAKLSGILSRFTRFLAVFEIYGGSTAELRSSVVLTDFQIELQGQAIFAGKGVVLKLLNIGSKTICEVSLSEAGWKIPLGEKFLSQPEMIAGEFNQLFTEWQKFYKVGSEFKVVVVDIQTFLHNLQLWLNQVELQVQTMAAGKLEFEDRVLKAIGKTTTPILNRMFERFEYTAHQVHPDSHAAHSAFAKQVLHSLLLCSPFLHRTFTKPLGYAGDYEMVNMLNRNPFEGSTLYAKIINLWFWEQPPAEAHRNRLIYLAKRIEEEAARLIGKRKRLRVFNFACGPAVEIQEFLKRSPLARQVDFLLSDFNQETLEYSRAQFRAIQGFASAEKAFKFQKKSVAQLLKESDRIAAAAKDSSLQHDFVYCAGLFDYLSDRTCKELMNAFYNFVAPGGVLLVTNVDSSNPRRPTMDMIMEWHLIYRNAEEFRGLRPDNASPDDCTVISDPTGVNIYLECRKPLNG